jgi:endonuclease YncB( thermonuclease family)
VGAERLAVALLLLAAAVASGCRSEGETSVPAQTAVVERVNDGDTLTLRTGARIRLVQIDAPELFGECYGRAASRALESLARPGTRITLSADKALDERDQHGRLLRYVAVGETNVNVELVRRGAASPYFFRGDRGRHADELFDAVQEARDARRGYWGACSRAELNAGIGAITGPA